LVKGSLLIIFIIMLVNALGLFDAQESPVETGS
jgi:hypothetical protein